jgi:hypothetical protein
MPRCLHISDSGFQCIDESLPEDDFCGNHTNVIEFERLEDARWRKAFRRFVAFLLLVAFLIPLIYTLRHLYLSRLATPLEAR